MSIREEFEKALWASDVHYLSLGEKAVAIWAAQWIAERCAKHLESGDGAVIRSKQMADEIRQLAKELAP